MERIVVRDHIYLALQRPPHGLFFDDQYAFRPTGSTTAALIKLIHEVTAMLETNPYVIIYAIVFQRRSTPYDTVSFLTSIRGWICLTTSTIGSSTFFRDHTHCTRFGGE